jgi:hypothetical protein
MVRVFLGFYFNKLTNTLYFPSAINILKSSGLDATHLNPLVRQVGHISDGCFCFETNKGQPLTVSAGGWQVIASTN